MRRRKLVTAVVLVVVVAVGVFVLWPRTDRIIRENFDRIQPGMSLAEVEVILGPPGDYTTGPIDPWHVSVQRRWSADEVKWLANEEERNAPIWTTDTAAAQVYFGPSGEAVDAIYIAWTKQAQGPVDYLLWRAERIWYHFYPPK
jgi:hypothetical protein